MGQFPLFASAEANSKSCLSANSHASLTAPRATASEPRAERTSCGGAGSMRPRWPFSGSSKRSPARESPPPRMTAAGSRRTPGRGRGEEDDGRGDAAGERAGQRLHDPARGRVALARGGEDDRRVDGTGIASSQSAQQAARLGDGGGPAEPGIGGSPDSGLERPRVVMGDAGVLEEGEVADLSGRAVGPAVRLALDQKSGTDADAQLEVEGIVDAAGRTAPLFGKD